MEKLPKSQRLNGRNNIQELFEKGSTKTLMLFVYPFRVVYLKENCSETKVPAVLVSVSKRNFKKAVDRNLIKRRIREAYRISKKSYDLQQLPKHLAFMYVGKEIHSFVEINEKLNTILSKLTKVNH